MEENVALDSKKQKKFVKSIRGIKKLIKKNKGKPEAQKKDGKAEPQKPFSMRLKGGKVNKSRKRKERGLVYLSHIPHGFYEHQMTQYFKQFGVVTNVRVIRSKRTGNSKGFAFVEFREPAVGQIVAETMNNYLMGKRLIKAAYIPPEKQKLKAFRKHWNSVNNPGAQLRLKMKKEFNADKDENGELKRARKLLSNFNKNKKKLSELGINYDFFAPVDVPEALLNEVVKQEKDDNASVKEKNKPKKGKKDKQEQTENKKVGINENAHNAKQTNVGKAKKNEKESKLTEIIKKGVSNPPTDKKENVAKANKKEKLPVKVNEKQQQEKEQQLKKAGVKSAKEFIKLEEESGDDSDSSEYAFDSDEYDKLLEKMAESSELSMLSDEDDDDEGGNVSEDDEEAESDDEEEEPPKKVTGKQAPKIMGAKANKETQKQLQNVKQQAKLQEQKQQNKLQVQKQQNKPQAQKQQNKAQTQKQQVKPQLPKQEQKKPIQAKRKAPQTAVAPKKPKFEKQSQKPIKKQFKKK